jgi:hypothetical protein
MNESWVLRSDRGKLKTVGIWLVWIISAVVHQTIALAGIPVLSTFLIFTLISIFQGLNIAVPSNLASKLLTQVPGYPIQALLALILGLVLGRYFQRRVMLWVWVLPLALFCFVLLFPPLNGSSIFGPYFASQANHHATIRDQLSWSILVVPSLAYSLGGKLAKPKQL